jgi:hypothetical protein
MKHYNIFALQGDVETTDQEVCETLGLDPKLANTPEINEAAIKAMHRQNYDGYVASGMEPEDAIALADERANNARSYVKSLMNE